MVSRNLIRRFWRADAGISLVEGVLVLPLILLVFAALVEFGYGVFQWNQTVKAMQLGARLAAVSDPLVDLAPLAAPADPANPPEAGEPTPNPITVPVSISCGPGTGNTCLTSAPGVVPPTGLAWIIGGSDGVCSPTAGGRPGMCDFNPRIGVDNIVVTYHRSGLGYVGRPIGPVATITVEARDLGFDLPLVGGLISFFTDQAGGTFFRIPANPVTMTSEDLCTSKDPFTAPRCWPVEEE